MNFFGGELVGCSRCDSYGVLNARELGWLDYDEEEKDPDHAAACLAWDEFRETVLRDQGSLVPDSDRAPFMFGFFAALKLRGPA